MSETKEAKYIDLLTPRGRLSFPALDEPRAMEQGKTPTYQATILLDREAQATREFKMMQKAVEIMIQRRWGTNVPKKLKRPFLTLDDLNNVPDGYTEEHVIIRMNSTIQPGLVDGRNRELIGPQIRKELYPGCYVRIATHPYTWVHPTGGPGVSFSLNHVQKMADGEPFTARKPVTDVFSPIMDDEETDDLVGFMD